jgi:hypothetical protein
VKILSTGRVEPNHLPPVTLGLKDEILGNEAFPENPPVVIDVVKEEV